MATQFLTLAIPAADGVGAALDVSGLDAEKTIVVDGVFGSSQILLEGSNDGANYIGVARLLGESKSEVAFTLRYVRANRSQTRTGDGTPTVGISSPSGFNQFSALNVPSGDGNGTETSIQTVTGVKTVIVSGAYSGLLFLEGRSLTGNWAPITLFPGAGIYNFSGEYAAIRVNRQQVAGGSLPVVIFGGEIDNTTNSTDWINVVRDYGAVADWNPATGTGTDNRTAFANAYAAGITLGRPVYIPAGSYMLDLENVSYLDVTGNLRVFGDGKNSTLLKVSKSGVAQQGAVQLLTVRVRDGATYREESLRWEGPTTAPAAGQTCNHIYEEAGGNYECNGIRSTKFRNDIWGVDGVAGKKSRDVISDSYIQSYGESCYFSDKQVAGAGSEAIFNEGTILYQTNNTALALGANLHCIYLTQPVALFFGADCKILGATDSGITHNGGAVAPLYTIIEGGYITGCATGILGNSVGVTQVGPVHIKNCTIGVRANQGGTILNGTRITTTAAKDYAIFEHASAGDVYVANCHMSGLWVGVAFRQEASVARWAFNGGFYYNQGGHVFYQDAGGSDPEWDLDGGLLVASSGNGIFAKRGNWRIGQARFFNSTIEFVPSRAMSVKFDNTLMDGAAALLNLSVAAFAITVDGSPRFKNGARPVMGGVNIIYANEGEMRGYSVAAPAAATVAAVHAAFAGNNASNNFPGPFTSPAKARNIGVTFGAGWDGGNITAVGTDQFGAAQSEVIVANPGAQVLGVKIFGTVTSATKGAVGVNPATASIDTGDKLGVKTLLGAVRVLFVDDEDEAVAALDQTYQAFTPTSLANGAKNYKLLTS